MKVWISICLMWLMVRVVSARPLGPESGNIIWSDETPSHAVQKLSVTIGDVEFSAIGHALKDLEFQAPRRNEAEQDRIQEIIAIHDSLEHLIARPMLSQGNSLGLSVPRPNFEFNSLEKRLYEVLAVRYLYPEVRLIHALSQILAQKLGRDGFLIGREERLELQKDCFAQNQFSEECLYENGFKPLILNAVESVNNEHEASLKPEGIYQQVLGLLEKGGQQSVVYWDAFAADAAGVYAEKQSIGDLLVSCVSYPRRFFAWQLVGPGRCDEAIKERLAKEGVKSKVLVSEILNRIMNPFSELQMALVSLSEEILNRGVLCFSDACVERKIDERISQWSYASELSASEKKALVKALAMWWLE